MARRTLTRRTFLRFSGGALTLYGLNKFGVEEAIAAAIPGGTLLPGAIPKFVTPLVQPPAMPKSGPNAYSIAVQQFTQQILPTSLPATTVWSYGSTTNPATRNYPAFTIEAIRNTPTTVTWINWLTEGSGGSGNFLPHLLPVDPTLHWANPPGGVGGRDSRPTFTTTPGRYTGPVPIVTHVHGMERVDDWSDGYAEAWFLPDAGNIPAGFAREGTWYNFFRAKASSAGVPPWNPGQAIFRYPNSQRPSTAWYHDHTLGMTRLNVYAGPAGFYLIRSNDPADDPTVAGTGARAVLPGPAASQGEPAPFYEIPIAIQDRSFNTDGLLFYPDTRAFFDGFPGPYIPGSDVSPIWNPEFFGNCIVVNGKTWPFLEVEPRRYRFRLLNGCQSRFLILQFDDPKVEVWQIGAEGGFLRAPVKLNEILMGLAERADIIVDFSKVKFGTNVTLINVGPDAPFAGGGFRRADPMSTGLVMRFAVNQPLVSADNTTPPAQLVMPTLPPLTGGLARSLALLELAAEPPLPDMPIEARLGTFDTTVGLPDGIRFLKWADPETENPGPNTTEVWELYNFTADAHPIHIHEVLFEVVNRQRLDKQTGLPIQTPVPPGPTENGRKDTVIAYPGEVTRVRITFGPGGQYVWHCHIVEHEDNEMMRPYRIGPVQPGQPA
jgi:FtsP/CotA-like multicopper oxidase with cupredoxin domain